MAQALSQGVRGLDPSNVLEEVRRYKLQNGPAKVAMQSLDCAAWLRSLHVEETVVHLVETERVSGSQLLKMTVDDLISDLGMSKLQAKRVILSRDGLLSFSTASPSSTDRGQRGRGKLKSARNRIHPEPVI